MSVKICRYCEQEFKPSRYHPNQDVCASRECQLRRRTDYHRQKIVKDPIYREQCRDSQRKWREQNPDYMKKYLLRRRQKLSQPETSALATDFQHLLTLIKNNLAFDLKPSTAAIWLVYPHAAGRKKNIFANAKVLAVQGTVYVLLNDRSQRTSL
jgi:hypothetical protein